MQFSKNSGTYTQMYADSKIVIVALVGLTGLEPVTLRLSSACSNQLSYRPIVVSSKHLFTGYLAELGHC